MDKPCFSIIIPMYNAERYIKICIDSILNQTFQDFEIIVVDDASTDNSCKICSELYGTNKKVRLIRQDKNHGTPSLGRNYGLENSFGEYIWFIDNDDAIIPTALEKIYNATKAEQGVDVIHCLGSYRTSQDNANLIEISKLTLKWDDREEGFLDEDVVLRLSDNWVKKRIWIATWINIYNRDFLVKHNMRFLDCLVEDMSISFEALCYAKKYLMFREAIYIWRQRSNSLSNKTDFNRFKLYVKSFMEISNFMSEVMEKIPALKNNRILKEQSALQIVDYIFPHRTVPFYNGAHISAELDNAVYDAMVPIFGANTTLAKYLFHGFNAMFQKANSLSQQVRLLQKREAVYQKQDKLIEQLKKLLDQYER